jgi:two-component system NtrC family response regulator
METPERNIMSLKEARSSIEKQKLLEVIETTTNNLSKAAAILGISRPTIYSLMKKYEISLQKD